MMSFRSKKLLVSQGAFCATLIFCVGGVTAPLAVFAEEKKSCVVNWRMSLCQPANFRSLGKTAAQMEEERRRAFAAAEAKRRANAWPTAFVKISKDMKSPNSVRIPFAQAPGIATKTKDLNGRRVCAGKLETGKKSKQDKDVHIDRECCLDKDEIPNPRCYYPQLGANNAPERITTVSGQKIIK